MTGSFRMVETSTKTLCSKCSLIFFRNYGEIRECMKGEGINPADCRTYREYTELEKRFLRESGLPEKLLTELYTAEYRKTEPLLYMKEKMKELLRGRWFMLIGGTGLGKSFAAGWAFRSFLRRKFTVDWVTNLRGSLYWIPVRRIETFLRFSESQAEFYEKVKNASLLVLDDLGEESPDGKPNWKTKYIGYLIEERYDRNRPTLFTTNLQITPHTKEEIITRLYGKRVYSRLEEVCTYKGFTGVDLRKIK